MVDIVRHSGKIVLGSDDPYAGLSCFLLCHASLHIIFNVHIIELTIETGFEQRQTRPFRAYVHTAIGLTAYSENHGDINE